MKIINKLILLKEQYDTSTNNQKNDYEGAIEAYNQLIKDGITKPRGYCLSSIADYTNIEFINQN